MADPLSILFGSTARVKLLRFFLFNPSKEFLFDDISKRARLVRRTAKTEMSALEKAGVIRQLRIRLTKIFKNFRRSRHSFLILHQLIQKIFLPTYEKQDHLILSALREYLCATLNNSSTS
jgi:hypothetical protein